MGEVFRARDTRLGREVAIKCLLPEVADDARRRERFSLEAQAIARLTHPNICTLYDLASEQGHLFLVMELVDGETLGARISRAPRGLDPDEALTIAHSSPRPWRLRTGSRSYTAMSNPPISC